MAQAAGGAFLLRIEDLDGGRSRPEYETGLRDDLAWLGLSWPEPVLRQSDNLPAYAAALDRLTALGLTYPCACTRADIRAAVAAPQEGATSLAYPGTCRGRPMAEMRPGDAIRLDVAAALAAAPPLHWHEVGGEAPGRHLVDAVALAPLGDVVLARKEIGAAYHLAVVVDDAAQEISHVVRGADLLEATPLHRLLQALLRLPAPVWHHHRLIRDAAGRRLAKRDDARALAALRAEGATPADIRHMVCLESAPPRTARPSSWPRHPRA